MSASRQNRNISALSHRVKAGLYDLKGHLEWEDWGVRLSTRPGAIEDIIDRYSLWTGNLGALHSPKSKLSLDQRLTNAPEVRDQICEFLDDLQEAVDDLTEITLQELYAGDETDLIEDGWEADIDNALAPDLLASDEAKSIIEVISQCVRSLFRVGVLIRREGHSDRFQRALQHSDCTFPTWVDIGHVRNKYPKLCKPEAGQLAERVGNANAKRRQYVKYCRDHQSRLAYLPDNDNDDTNTAIESSKATTFFPDSFDRSTQSELNITEEEDNISLSTATTLESSTRVELPSLQDLSPDSEPFECPICFTLQSFRIEKAWRSHAFRDLKAYICTVGGTKCKDELFGTRDAWFYHELQSHRSKYTCLLCDECRK
ncbi:uncharacterized protein F4822DRAFT_354088 [Hypoxylon trugodes]|uniref:uncharacterized protein n=1 Tax=Hypoxylon trugodes TaxID=326681 RepID=UPI002198503D|nr:uncharacterized protein F4822DRAFT_354088 [Hypoxylon trugodes]KAI1385762.1 hypothetical protein F4822DRAFT_354088 [Hypoxylon trugodes]